MKTALLVISLALLLHLATSKGGGGGGGRGGGAARGGGRGGGKGPNGYGGSGGRGLSGIHLFGGGIFIFAGAGYRHRAVETCVNTTMSDLTAQNDTDITVVGNAEKEARQECEGAMNDAVVGESLLVGFFIFFFVGVVVYCGLRCYFSKCCRRKRSESAYHPDYQESYNEGRIATTNMTKKPMD